MAREFRLPDIGEGLVEAEIVRWLVPVGGYVDMDEPVVEVETDKALMEIPSPFAGIVVSHGAPEGSVIEVGEVLVVIGDPDEQMADEQDGAGDAAASGESPPIVGTISSEAVDLTRPSVDPSGETAPPPGRTSATPNRTVQTLPMIRKMATELGVDLSAIEGSGPGGRITREDVQTAALEIAESTEMSMESEPDESPGLEPVESSWTADELQPDPEPIWPAAVSQPEPTWSAVDAEADEDPEPEPGDMSDNGGQRMSATRRAIADHMERSWREIPHVTTFARVDVSKLMDARRALGSRHGSPVSIDAMVVKAVVAALREHPAAASRLRGDVIIPPEKFDIGVAVDTPEGLMVVVVDDPTDTDLIALTAEIARLAEAARERTLNPNRFRGQCFTVSNIGAVGGGYGTPIVPYGTSGILSVGRAEETPVARDGAVVIAPMMPLSFSYDHRLIDGAGGRRFLDTVTENLAEPALFLA